MLPFVVLVLGIVFLILWYSGLLRDFGDRRAGPSERLEFPDAELERRLKVFERFLSGSGQESSGEEDDRNR